MLNKETSDKLAVLGFDVSKLTEAIKAEAETSLEVPRLYPETDYNKFGENKDKEGFERGKLTVTEILAKKMNDKYSLGFEEKDRRDFDKVTEALISKALKDAKIEPDKKVKELQDDIAKLKDLHESTKTDYEGKLKSMEGQVFNSTLRSSLGNELQGEYMIPKDDIYDIYITRNRVTKDDTGRAVVLNDKGEILKTDTREPISVNDHYKAFADKYVKKDGMGGDDKTKAIPGKFAKMSEFKAYCETKKIEPLSEDAQKFLRENKAEKFDYSS
jgi:hypothetical protein